MRAKKLTSLAVSVILAITMAAPACATEGSKTARLDYSDIKITLNGDIVFPVDANGNYVEPFAIEGTTYLPVRAIGNAMGLNVGWDASTKTVVLTTGGGSGVTTGAIPDSSGAREVTAVLDYDNIKITLDGVSVVPLSANNEPVEPFAINGTTYLPVRGIASTLGLNVDWDGTTNTVVLTTQSTDSSNSTSSEVPTGWLPYNPGSTSALLDAALKGYVIYRNGQYWCSPEYASIIGNENIVSSVDISGNNGQVSNGNIIDGNTKVDILVGIEALDGIRATLTSKKLYEVIASGGDYSNATVSDIEVLQYCMPSLPDDFIDNPVSGTYDGIRVVVISGEIKMYEQDLIDMGFI